MREEKSSIVFLYYSYTLAVIEQIDELEKLIFKGQ